MNMWCVARFGISHYLAFAWSFERMRMHANAFFYLHVVFIRLHELAFKRVYQMSNVWMPFKRVNTSNLMTFECCFLISKIMRIAMQCHPSLYYVMYLGTLLFAVQRNIFISLSFLFVYLFIHLLLVMQQVRSTVSLLEFQQYVLFSSVIFKKAFQDQYN